MSLSANQKLWFRTCFRCHGPIRGLSEAKLSIFMEHSMIFFFEKYFIMRLRRRNHEIFFLKSSIPYVQVLYYSSCTGVVSCVVFRDVWKVASGLGFDFCFVFYTQATFQRQFLSVNKLISGSPSGCGPYCRFMDWSCPKWTTCALALANWFDLSAIIAAKSICIVESKVSGEVVFATSSVTSFTTWDAKSTIVITMLVDWGKNIQGINEAAIAFTDGTFNSTIHII